MVPLRHLAFALSITVLLGTAALAQPSVTTLRVPDGGIQPQVAAAADGTIHLLYFKGRAEAGDLFYAVMKSGEAAFSKPVRVNSAPNSAVAVGNIRGGQIALGKDGRPHVAWNAPFGGGISYTRLTDDAAGFEPQKNTVQWTTGLDGGGGVAADTLGNVYVVWHANEARGQDESQRRVFIARSFDQGGSFMRESAASAASEGACGCCSVKAAAQVPNRLYVLYRGAAGNSERGSHLLYSDNGGTTFKDVRLDSWSITQCPMSSASVTPVDGGAALAWEREGQVFTARFDADKGTLGEAYSPPGDAKARQHPVIAINAAGQTLLAWTEGMGWSKGGAAAWQVFDKDGKPIDGAAGKADGVPVWGLVAAFAKADGSFVVVY